MRCHQCERPAIYRMENFVLCLQCADQLQSLADRQQAIVNAQFLQNAAMLNQSIDHSDSMIPLGMRSDLVPLAEIARAMSGRTVLNNIQISNSTVGAVNTGDLAKIDAFITATKGTDAEDIGARLQQLTQA